MKIAYLLLAHEQPQHFHRLVKALLHSSQTNTLYAHIDLKSDISRFHCPEFDNGHATFIDTRVSVNHSGFSTVRAMFHLMVAASATHKYDYYVFLSGRDYPIKHRYIINTYLSSHHPLNFINFYPLIGDADLVCNIDKYSFVDFVARSPSSLRYPLKGLQKVLRRLPTHRSFISGMTPFRGSQWFCLNHDTICYILDFLTSNKSEQYIRFFKNTWCSEEIFFHTIVLNSKYSASCHLYNDYITAQNAHDVITNENKAYLHYIDWDKHREDPAVLDMRDLQALKDSDALFARKFCTYKSQHLLDYIDTALLHLS